MVWDVCVLATISLLLFLIPIHTAFGIPLEEITEANVMTASLGVMLGDILSNLILKKYKFNNNILNLET